MIELKEIIMAIRKQEIRYTYIMIAEYENYILFKIGISKNPMERLTEIKKRARYVEGLPNVKLLASIPYNIEMFLHERLKSHQHHGEWFNDCEDIRFLIQIFKGISTNIYSFHIKYVSN